MSFLFNERRKPLTPADFANISREQEIGSIRLAAVRYEARAFLLQEEFKRVSDLAAQAHCQADKLELKGKQHDETKSKTA